MYDLIPAPRAALRAMLLRHEGLRTKPYRCTAGWLTIGVGRNLETKGISREEALYLLDSDIAAFTTDVLRRWPWTATLDDARFDAVADMCFNMGCAGVGQFVEFLGALQAHDYEAAARAMLDSRWAQQVGGRARELAEMIRTGRYSEAAEPPPGPAPFTF